VSELSQWEEKDRTSGYVEKDTHAFFRFDACREEKRCQPHQAERTHKLYYVYMLLTMMNRCFLISLLVAILASTSNGFVVKAPNMRPATVSLEAHLTKEKIIQVATTAAVVLSTSPLMALAEEDYEYGAVSAPIGLAWGAGVLAILTALLPVALKGGEEAFEEMKDKDKDKWGSGKSDALNSRRKK
jgi:hypothetical protein